MGFEEKARRVSSCDRGVDSPLLVCSLSRDVFSTMGIFPLAVVIVDIRLLAAVVVAGASVRCE